MKVLVILLLMTSVASAGPFFLLERGQSTENADYSFCKVNLGYRYSFRKGWFVPEVYGGWTTWAYKLKYPFNDIYTIGAKIGIKAFFMRWEHCCVHPVESSYNTIENEEGNQVFKEWRITPNMWSGDYSIFSMGFEHEFK